LNKLLTVMVLLSALWWRDATTKTSLNLHSASLMFLIILLQMQCLSSSNSWHLCGIFFYCLHCWRTL